ncbi:H-NS histone family protein [Comamonas sp. CMM01]|uniref:H-NS histone family protein n=1 Tax=Comamonas sp. CMM01 TaxID=2769280 RepID=UPI00177AFF1A|nr:H-NS histone family protein [Comamonas sp. CMM01]MBD9530865.1 H-NS histone family protein [Comamonas sp. CMM01]
MSSYKALLQQREQLEQQIQQARKAELSEAVAKVRALVTEYDLTQEDVFPSSKPKATRQAVAPKYRDPATGATWTGRGKPPLWIADKDRAQFEIK